MAHGGYPARNERLVVACARLANGAAMRFVLHLLPAHALLDTSVLAVLADPYGRRERHWFADRDSAVLWAEDHLSIGFGLSVGDLVEPAVL